MKSFFFKLMTVVFTVVVAFSYVAVAMAPLLILAIGIKYLLS